MNRPMTWGSPYAGRADAARNRRLLLATAREMITGQGAGQLTTDGLAERVGPGKGTVFRRFGIRAGIFAALLDEQAAPQVSERLARGWEDLIQRVCQSR